MRSWLASGLGIFDSRFHCLQAKSADSAAERQEEAAGSAAPAAEAAPPVQNWAELYAIVGSLFESGVSVTDHLAMLQHLPDKQRCGARSLALAHALQES